MAGPSNCKVSNVELIEWILILRIEWHGEYWFENWRLPIARESMKQS